MSEPKKTIRFSANHNNKLGCDFFTTIRPAWDYYKQGEFYGVVYNNKVDFEVQIMKIKQFMLKDVNEFISALDAGIGPQQFIGLMNQIFPKKDFSKDPLYLMLLRKVK